MKAKVFAMMLVAGMAAGGAADQLNLYLNPVGQEAAFDAALIGSGRGAPAADEANLRSAALDQPARR